MQKEENRSVLDQEVGPAKGAELLDVDGNVKKIKYGQRKIKRSSWRIRKR